MKPPSAELSYRRVAVEEASSAGLVVILYDMLVNDLRRAVEAMHRGAIEDRSRHLKHALLVLQVLESGLDMEKGGAAARNLADFYACVRHQVLAAQFQNDFAILERQVTLILDVREAWCSPDTASKSNPAISPQAPAAQIADGPDRCETSQLFA
jgi:flagellar biosynthetic protein FliS